MDNGSISRTVDDKLPGGLSGRDATNLLLKVSTHHTLYLVSPDGRAAALSVQSLPEAANFSDGPHFSHISPFGDKDILAGMFSVPRDVGDREKYILTVSRAGMVKKTVVQDLPGPSSQLFTLAKINGGDELFWMTLTEGSSQILLITGQGMGIRFSEQEVRPMGLVATGVNGIKMKEGDHVIGAEQVEAGDEVLLLANGGRGWRMPIEEFPVQGRYGQGVIACKLNRGESLSGILAGKSTQQGIAHFTKAAARMIRVDAAPSGKRARAGQAAVPVKSNDDLAWVTPVLDGMQYWLPGKEEKPARKRRAPAKKTTK
jgi:DNA gyrase subunit A